MTALWLGLSAVHTKCGKSQKSTNKWKENSIKYEPNRRGNFSLLSFWFGGEKLITQKSWKSVCQWACCASWGTPPILAALRHQLLISFPSLFFVFTFRTLRKAHLITYARQELGSPLAAALAFFYSSTIVQYSAWRCCKSLSYHHQSKNKFKLKTNKL